MGGLDAALLAERAAAVQRHLRRVSERLPGDPADLRPMSDATDAVILHLWQAIQVVIDVAVSACVQFGLGSPPSYGEAFRMLRTHGAIDDGLAARLARAAGFRNVLVHAYADLDLALVHDAALHGPNDLTAFLAALRDHLKASAPEEDAR
jgi:uncharacterized protein YutE (UPF0331/DUF86 family)